MQQSNNEVQKPSKLMRSPVLHGHVMVTSVVLIIRRMCDKYIEEDTPQQNLRGWGGGGASERKTQAHSIRKKTEDVVSSLCNKYMQR